MNTPETGQVYGAEATAKNRELVGGKSVYLEKDVSETDRYGRLLRYVYLADGTLVNRELVRLGYAQIATYPPDVKYEAQIRAAQREAMDAGRGLWANTSSPTATPRATSRPTATPTPRPVSGPTVNSDANLRAGPGTNFAIAGRAASGDPLEIVGRNGAGDWYQLGNGAWIAAFLVTNAPSSVPVAQNIPTPAPTQAMPVQPSPAQAPPQAPVSSGTGRVIIQFIYYDGQVYRVESDEYAMIANTGTVAVNIGGWRLNAGDPGQDFRFPNFVLEPGRSCRVYTNEYYPESCGFSFGSGRAIWNNDGDCGYLFDAGGQQVDDYCY
jgi:hypothetical protein